mmetsp:Transcript_21831/g.67482  ORF Transcript_21831/g.67482 Transcript_21831/m.67482 type:complete len:235 (+) Transcript_21831:470-1174(+)
MRQQLTSQARLARSAPRHRRRLSLGRGRLEHHRAAFTQRRIGHVRCFSWRCCHAHAGEHVEHVATRRGAVSRKRRRQRTRRRAAKKEVGIRRAQHPTASVTVALGGPSRRTQLAKNVIQRCRLRHGRCDGDRRQGHGHRRRHGLGRWRARKVRCPFGVRCVGLSGMGAGLLIGSELCSIRRRFMRWHSRLCLRWRFHLRRHDAHRRILQRRVVRFAKERQIKGRGFSNGLHRRL